MNNPVTQMAAISTAMRMLLADNIRAKPDDLLIAASTGVTPSIAEMMMGHATDKRSIFLIIFHIEDELALMEKVMVVDGSTAKGEINIGCGKFVRKPDGSFAVLSISQAKPYEYRFNRSARRLVRRAVREEGNRALMELEGLQALIAKAATVECQTEAIHRSVTCS